MVQNNALNKSSEDFTVDNLFLDGNTLSSTSGGIFIQPLAGQGLALVADNVAQDYEDTGANLSHRVRNTATTDTSSNAFYQVQVANGSVGDPWVNWNISGIQAYTFGIDNSDSDIFKLTNNTSFTAGPTLWQMTNAGERTLPLQPAFLAYLGTNANNVTGDSTTVGLGGDTAALTEVFDQNNDFSPGDGAGTDATFTAPVTCRYLIGTSFRFNNITGNTTTILDLHTSNRLFRYTTSATGTSSLTIDKSEFVDMDAADTWFIDGSVAGVGADTSDVIASSAQTNMWAVAIC